MGVEAKVARWVYEEQFAGRFLLGFAGEEAVWTGCIHRARRYPLAMAEALARKLGAMVLRCEPRAVSPAEVYAALEERGLA